MGLTGIQIYKLLPKKNCKECGEPTCLAFAMKLAAGKAELSACPYVSEEAKAQLAEASAPPILPVTVGKGDKAFKVGGETVLFRHEKRFENPPAIGILITDAMDGSEVDARLEKLNKLQYERVGLILRGDLVVLKSEKKDPDAFASLVADVKGKTDFPIMLIADDISVLKKGAEAAKDINPILYAATKENVDEMISLVKEMECAVVVKGDGLGDVAELTERFTKEGIKSILIDSGARGIKEMFFDLVASRRAALLQKFRPLGFPPVVLPFEMTDDPLKEALIATMAIAKYAGVIVLSDFYGETLFPLLVGRMNIYTDPQRPMTMTEGIYEINNPTEDSPVCITTNFALTYFVVAGEIESSRVPTWLLVMDTEGLSVLTAWAAGKFVADAIGPFVKKCGIADRIKHRKLIIPGYVAGISGELEEELPDWEIMIGPREAAHLPPYLKQWG